MSFQNLFLLVAAVISIALGVSVLQKPHSPPEAAVLLILAGLAVAAMGIIRFLGEIRRK